MKTPKELFLSPSDIIKPSGTGVDKHGHPMDVYWDLCAWSSPPNHVVEGCRYTDISQLWHCGDEDPDLYVPCLLEVTYHFEDRKPIPAIIMSYYGKYGRIEENVAKNATYTIIHRWAYIHELQGENDLLNIEP